MKRLIVDRHRRGVVLVLVVLLAATTAGCSSGSETDGTTTSSSGSASSSTEAPVDGSTGSPATSSTTSQVPPVEREPTPADPTQFSSAVDGTGERFDLYGELAFTTPTGNIVCDIHGEPDSLDHRPPFATCLAMESTWSIPEEPCELDWADSVVSLGSKGVERGACTGDSPVTYGSNELPYDSSLTQGPITCVSRRTGVVCTYAGTEVPIAGFVMQGTPVRVSPA